MRRRCIVSALLLVGMSYATPANAAAITFTSVLTANNDLQVSIEILGVEDLLAFDFGVNFNQAATLLQVDEGDFLSGDDGRPDDGVRVVSGPDDATMLRLIGVVFEPLWESRVEGARLPCSCFPESRPPIST